MCWRQPFGLASHLERSRGPGRKNLPYDERGSESGRVLPPSLSLSFDLTSSLLFLEKASAIQPEKRQLLYLRHSFIYSFKNDDETPEIGYLLTRREEFSLLFRSPWCRDVEKVIFMRLVSNTIVSA